MKEEQPNTEQSGTIPSIMNHYRALPIFYSFDQAPIEKISEKITRQYIMGSQGMVVKWSYKKGASIPLHFHPHEQITWITQGVAEVKSQGNCFTLKAGDMMVFPPFVPHEFFILEDTINIDFFSPVRDDWFAHSEYYLKAGHH